MKPKLGYVALCAGVLVSPLRISAAQRADTTMRSAGTAGTLSLLYPGAGSLYAGNRKHGLTHGTVAVASALAMVAAGIQNPCTGDACHSPSQFVAAGGLLTYLVNNIWSVVTAVRDADAHNTAVQTLALPTISQQTRDSATAVAGTGPGLSGLRPSKAHLGVGGGMVPYLSDFGGRTAEVRMGLTPNLWPDWTVAYSYNSVTNPKSTSYFAPECDNGKGCRPNAYARSQAFEVQRRWLRDQSVHPLATTSIGSLVTRYAYTTDGVVGFESSRIDSTQYTQFITLAAGLEANLDWVHGALTGGYRQARGRTIPNRTSSNSGPVLVWLVEIGKF